MSFLSNHHPDALDALNGRGPAPDPFDLTEDQHAELAEHGLEPLSEADMDAMFADHLAEIESERFCVDDVYGALIEEEARAYANGERAQS